MAGGANRMLDRLAMTNVNQNLSVTPIESDHSRTFQLLTNQLGLWSVSCFKESVHSSKALVNLGFKGLL